VFLKYLEDLIESGINFNEFESKDISNLLFGFLNLVDILMNNLNGGTLFSNDTSFNISIICIFYKFLKLVIRSLKSLDEEDKLQHQIHLLSIFHEIIGEKRFCCAKNGFLLKMIISEISEDQTSEDHFGHIFKVDLDRNSQLVLEQTFFCMFKYPTKSRFNKFADHHSRLKTHTWKDFVTFFNYFKPQIFPQFDSLKAITITQDFSQQIHKALIYTPHKLQEKIDQKEVEVNNYLEDRCQGTLMSLSSDVTSSLERDEMTSLGEMFYLLADYSFKSSEMTSAIKYYLLNLAIDPKRLDSWAGIALARSSQTDGRLRRCEPKSSQNKISKSGTERRAQLAVSCFQQALRIDKNNVKLLIEFGSLTYWLQAMYSRELNRKSNNLLPNQSLDEDDLCPMEEKIKEIEDLKLKKIKMLELAHESFETVRQCDSDDVYEEEWFIEYMLGKICEKQKKPLTSSLRHYQEAANRLHYRSAKYPKKIQSRYSMPNDLMVEPLEMFFRLHASALSFLSNHARIDPKNPNFYKSNFQSPQEQQDLLQELDTIKDILDEAANSPFALRRELKSGNQTSASSSQENKLPSKLIGGVKTSKDFIIGSLVPESVQQALNFNDVFKIDEDSTSSKAQDSPLLLTATNTPSSGSFSQEENEIINLQKTTKIKDQLISANDWKIRIEDTILSIVDHCEAAFQMCLHRYPQHYKSVYRLAHLYATWSHKLHLEWSRDLLYGAPFTSSWQQLAHMPSPGLLADRNKTNLFNGVWRVTVDDIDRPGSFSSHLYRCVALLCYVLRQLKDNKSLLHIHNLLNRIPDSGRQYLKDEDRIRLARRAIVYTRSIVRRKIRSYPNSSPDLAPLTPLLNQIPHHRPIENDFRFNDVIELSSDSTVVSNDVISFTSGLI